MTALTPTTRVLHAGTPSANTSERATDQHPSRLAVGATAGVAAGGIAGAHMTYQFRNSIGAIAGTVAGASTALAVGVGCAIGAGNLAASDSPIKDTAKDGAISGTVGLAVLALLLGGVDTPGGALFPGSAILEFGAYGAVVGGVGGAVAGALSAS